MQATEAKPRTAIYGARISRGGEVYGFLARPVQGRCPESQQALLGHVWRVKGGWKTDVCCDIYPSQTDAADAVIRITCGPIGLDA
jgi:hypothetical protein